MEDVGDRFSLIVCIIYPVLIRLCPLLGLETALQLEFDRHVVKRRLISRGVPLLYDRRGHRALLAVGQRAVVVEKVVALFARVADVVIRQLVRIFHRIAVLINCAEYWFVVDRALAQRLAHRVDISVTLGSVFGQGVGFTISRKIDGVGVLVSATFRVCCSECHADKTGLIYCAQRRILNLRSTLPCSVGWIAPQVECYLRVAALVEPDLFGGILGFAGQRELELAAAVNLGCAAAGVIDTRVIVADGEVVARVAAESA